MSKPTHIAYVVNDPKEGTDKKAMWREVGAIWPHGKGDGFDLVLFGQLSVSGRIVCSRPSGPLTTAVTSASWRTREPLRRKRSGSRPRWASPFIVPRPTSGCRSWAPVS